MTKNRKFSFTSAAKTGSIFHDLWVWSVVCSLQGLLIYKILGLGFWINVKVIRYWKRFRRSMIIRFILGLRNRPAGLSSIVPKSFRVRSRKDSRINYLPSDIYMKRSLTREETSKLLRRSWKISKNKSKLTTDRARAKIRSTWSMKSSSPGARLVSQLTFKPSTKLNWR